MAGAWLVRHGRRDGPTARLFCFPHAGVGASAYRLWTRGLPTTIDVCSIQAPGREDRLREAPLTSIPALVDGIMGALGPELDLPFVFFGHSMGATVATEVARALEARGGSLPAHLVVSGRRPPHLPGTETPLATLPDAEFVAQVQRRYGGIPTTLLEEPEVMALLLPTLRADFTALETHRPPERAPLPFPVTAIGGAEDALTPREHLEAWRRETTHAFTTRLFSGGHFYLAAHLPEVLALVAALMAPLKAGVADGATP
ncbi:MAG TPA: alpha/beta fold hydrolase [Polyangiaceae bacterium]|nr:alpha/beta fold hydrolase [Polyangiaceae bacterium]